MTHDAEFQASKYADKIKWLAKDYDDIFDPDYGDMLRVSFMHQFRRGKLADLVSLLSGRDFESKEYRDDIVEDSYAKLDAGIQTSLISTISHNSLWQSRVLALPPTSSLTP